MFPGATPFPNSPTPQLPNSSTPQLLNSLTPQLLNFLSQKYFFNPIVSARPSGFVAPTF